jgi:pescadillo protein
MGKRKPHTKKNRRGTTHGDKIHGTKKGTKGEATAYLTRASALKKLQLPLADFRKLCILKGIYPRDPKKKHEGNDKTYYHLKDILFLAHEPLLNKFMELKTFMKKFKRLMGRKEKNLAKRLEENKPKYTLHHLLRERYPSFDDALRDMDDAVSMLALFAALPAEQKREIPADAVDEANGLYQEFQLYVIRNQALRKVFASIKGYYFQVDVMGSTITWLSPHQFTQHLPSEVDFRVMLTFLEFHRCLVKFANFKLYSDLGLVYPPKRDQAKDEASAEVAAIHAEAREAEAAQENADVLQKESEETAEGLAQEFGQDSEDAQKIREQMAEVSRKKAVFRNLKIFISREVPFRPIYFTLLCGGAKGVGWERAESPFGAEDKDVTHQVVDRPPAHLDLKEGREYVQPQWILDSFNCGCQLPVGPYAPGKAPPPHLSPFVDDAAEGYVPRQREVLNALVSDLAPPTKSAGAGAAAATDDAAAEDGLTRFQEELKAESQGVWYSEFKDEKAKKAAHLMEGDENAEPSKKKNLTQAEEDKLNAKAVMSKKHKRLLQRIEKGQRQKEEVAEKLTFKRKKLEKAPA